MAQFTCGFLFAAATAGLKGESGGHTSCRGADPHGGPGARLWVARI